jgi:hypothetical protein
VNVSDELRREVAAVHGLPEAAESFLIGANVDEIEKSAAKLAELLAARRAPVEPEQPMAEQSMAAVISNSIIQKAQRQRQLIESLHPSTPQRDERGRFARTTRSESSSFDGGARLPVAVRRSPEQEHNEIVLRLAGLAKLGLSGRL